MRTTPTAQRVSPRRKSPRSRRSTAVRAKRRRLLSRLAGRRRDRRPAAGRQPAHEWLASLVHGAQRQAGSDRTSARRSSSTWRSARPHPSYDWLTFDLRHRSRQAGMRRAPALDATDPDLSRFRRPRRQDPQLLRLGRSRAEPADGRALLRKRHRKPWDPRRAISIGCSWCRGCSTAPAASASSTFDALTPLVEWVEKGIAPQSIAASRLVDGKVVRTRPLCPYPEMARYKGSGSIDEAANFSCVLP